MKELPQGWVECEIGDVAKVVGGGTPPSKDPTNFTTQGGIPWITPADLSGYKDAYISRGARNLSEKGYTNCSAMKLPAGSVLFSSRAPVGYVAIASTEVTTNQGFKSFALPESIDNRFVYYYLRHIKPIAEMMATGTTFKELSGSAAAKLPFILAPRNEQKRIADKLDTLLAQVEACRERLERVPRIIKRFRQAVLAAACSGRLTTDWRTDNPNVTIASEAIKRLHSSNLQIQIRRGVPETVKQSDIVLNWELPESWEFFSTAELLRTGAISDLKDGNHGVNHPKTSDFTPDGLPFITAAQVNNFQIDYEGAYKVSGKPLDQLRVGFAKANDVIYTHKGSVGRVAISDRCCVLTPQTTYYRVNPEILSNKFVMYYLASHYFIEQVAAVKEQTTRDFVPISEQYLLFHRVPPLSEQYEIVRRIEALFKLTEQLEARYRTAMFQVENMTPALLTKAFCGELVPQDPNDEPASELLKLIKEQTLDVPEQKRIPRANTIKNERYMNTKAATTLDELVSVLDQLGGNAMADRLVIESGLSDDIDRFYELLREGRNKFLDVPVGSNKPIRRIANANQ